MIAAIAVVLCLAIIVFTALISIHDKSTGDIKLVRNRENMLEGEVVDITYDVECEKTRITVKNDGMLIYGYSALSVSELEHLYLGKGYVQIPVHSRTPDHIIETAKELNNQ